MSRQHASVCPLPNGVHARPASALEEVARSFDSTITIVNERTGQAANAKSVLGIVGIDIRLGDRCLVTVEGRDEDSAVASLRSFLEKEFPLCDEPLPPPAAGAGVVRLPPMLAASGATVTAGTPVVQGIGRGRAVRIDVFAVPDSIPLGGATNPDSEAERLEAALEGLKVRYDERLAHAGASVEADILKAHRSVARDPEFGRRLLAEIRDGRRTAAGAIAAAERHFTLMLLATGSALLADRALDIRDVCVQLLRELYGEKVRGDMVQLTGDSVCLARTLTPGQFLSLDRRWLKGLVLGEGGATSHTAILARSFGIPTLVGVAGSIIDQLPQCDVIVDADLGVLVTKLTEGARRYYEMEVRRLEGRRRRLEQAGREPAITTDGTRVEVGANIGTAAEATAAFAGGADGIGLFRTEMLFVDRDRAPSEDEQFEEYRAVVAAAGDRSVIIRTLDIGGDKPVPYLRLPSESNPFLGYRAVRWYPEFDQVFREQVRALLRASAFGRLKVMVPMVSGADEVRWVIRVVGDEQARLARAASAFDPAMELGIMVEVPSVAFLIDRLSADLHFFSIGTNDLLQYFIAVDRTNSKVEHLYNPLSPAFLRLLRKIVDEAHASGRWVGLCGEMGGDMRALPLLIGLGLDELSMAAPAVPQAKSAVRETSAADCRALVGRTLDCSDAAEVSELVGAFLARCSAPLIDPSLVTSDGEARTKEEAIKELVDRLYIAGRTDRPRDVEDAVWRREAVYSTGFGHGFAIPHCKTDAVRANSLVILRLKAPVEWGSLDEKPVRTLVLLAIRESDQATAHMKVLAALARQMMHEDFRERLSAEADREALCRFLEERISA